MARLRFWLLCAAALSILGTDLLGQSQATTGVIEGTVVDEAGGTLPGVTVTLRNTGTNFETSSLTAGNGRFRAVLLPLGGYRVTASLTGFARTVLDGV